MKRQSFSSSRQIFLAENVLVQASESSWQSIVNFEAVSFIHATDFFSRDALLFFMLSIFRGLCSTFQSFNNVVNIGHSDCPPWVTNRNIFEPFKILFTHDCPLRCSIFHNWMAFLKRFLNAAYGLQDCNYSFWYFLRKLLELYQLQTSVLWLRILRFWRVWYLSYHCHRYSLTWKELKRSCTTFRTAKYCKIYAVVRLLSASFHKTC